MCVWGGWWCLLIRDGKGVSGGFAGESPTPQWMMLTNRVYECFFSSVHICLHEHIHMHICMERHLFVFVCLQDVKVHYVRNIHAALVTRLFSVNLIIAASIETIELTCHRSLLSEIMFRYKTQ